MSYRNLCVLTTVLFVSSSVGAGEPRIAPRKPVVAVDLTIIRTPEATAERFLTLANFENSKGRDDKEFTVANGLTSKQVRGWLEWLQEDKGTNFMKTPKVSLANGQSERIRLTEQRPIVKTQEMVQDGQLKVVSVKEMAEVGLIYEVRPTVSPERRSVRLDAKITLSSVTQELVPKQALLPEANGNKNQVGYLSSEQALATHSLNQVFDIPANGSVACCLGKTLTETRTEFGPPILSRIPYVSRLFRNVGYGREAHGVFVILTPQILECDE